MQITPSRENKSKRGRRSTWGTAMTDAMIQDLYLAYMLNKSSTLKETEIKTENGTVRYIVEMEKMVKLSTHL